jgi:hypothetical protein
VRTSTDFWRVTDGDSTRAYPTGAPILRGPLAPPVPGDDHCGAPAGSAVAARGQADLQASLKLRDLRDDGLISGQGLAIAR